MKHALLIIAACVAGAIYLYYAYHSKPSVSELESKFDKNAIHDTIYYKSKDAAGNISMIHDTGLKPSTLKKIPQHHVDINVLKHEYIDGVEKILGPPVELAIGHSIYNLATKIPILRDNINEKKNYYVVSIGNIWNKDVYSL